MKLLLEDGTFVVCCPCGHGKARGRLEHLEKEARGVEQSPFGAFMVCRACGNELRLNADGEPAFLPKARA